MSLAAALAALATAGCGSSTPVPTLAQFAERANEICVDLTQQQGAIGARPALAETDQTAADAQEWREIEAVSREADAKVQALPRPPAETATIAQLVAGYFQEANDEHTLADAYASGDAAAVRAADNRFITLARRDAAVARSLGMTDCAKAQ